MQVLLVIDESFRPGIAAARLARNASMPAQVQSGTRTVQMQQGTDASGAPIMVDHQVPNMVPNPDLIDTDEAYVQWVMSKAIESYHAQHVGAPAPAPAPTGSVTGQVMEIRKWQALIGMQRDGIKQAVLAFIGSLSQDAQDFWAGSTAIERSSPLFAAAKAHFGWTDAQIDDMFRRYSLITGSDITG